MNTSILRATLALCAGLWLVSCHNEAASPATGTSMFSHQRMTTHSGEDDLLSAGLGLNGLRMLMPPAFADQDAPTPAELRRRALWHSWRGLVDFAPGGGFGDVYGAVPSIPGREYSAYATLPGAQHPHRVLVQIPDGFDRARACVLIAPASGSRGVYGEVPIAASWGLPKGCAVAYTDKGAGSDYFDLETGIGVRADGTLGRAGEVDDLAFVPEVSAAALGVAIKHAHSKDNPEADWGRHVKQAAEFALDALNDAFPEAAPFTFVNTRMIAIGISNGGGAVLRAAEHDADWLDAVVAGEPNVFSSGAGSRPLYDYATEAALLMPCAQLHMTNLPQPPLTAAAQAAGTLRCASLTAEGIISGATPAAQAESAYALMTGAGWSEAALRAGALSTGFDLWRAVAVTYASAYGRYGAGEHPCGFSFAAIDAARAPRSFTTAERATWWSDASGIPPGLGAEQLIDPHLQAPDFTLPGLHCLRALWTGDTDDARRVQAGVAAIRAGVPREGLPVLVVHGLDDGLIPPAFSSAPYVAAAKAAGRAVPYWQIPHVQHFDTFLGFPDYAARYLPLLPYIHAALDRVSAHLDTGAALEDAMIASTPRGLAQALTAQHLGLQTIP